MTRARQRVLAVIAALGGVALFTYAVRRAGVDEIVDGIRRIGWGLLPILGLAGIRFLLRAAAWRRCMPPGARMSFGRAFSAFLSGDAVGNLTPLGMAASEPTKAVLVRHRLETSDSVSSLAIDNLVYAASIAVVVIVGLVVLLVIAPLPREGREVVIVGVIAIVIGGAVMLRVLRGTLSTHGPSTDGPPIEGASNDDARRPRWREWLSRVRQSIVGFWSASPDRVVQAFAFDMAFHVLAVYEIYLTLGWLLGGQPTIAQALVFEVLNRAVTAAFKFVPFRIGIDEALTGALAPMLAVQPVAGVTLALVRKVRNLAWTGVGLLLIAAAPARVAPASDHQGSEPSRPI
jgi:lysylphosphatidylglycerol synthase-like protein